MLSPENAAEAAIQPGDRLLTIVHPKASDERHGDSLTGSRRRPVST